MVLVDTSVWVEHFRKGVPQLGETLSQRSVYLHPVIIGELVTGNLKNRKQTFADLKRQPLAIIGTFQESLQFIEIHRLYSQGIGWNDIQLLVSAGLSHSSFWTRDKRLAIAAKKLGISYLP